jgi:hypothetical protein
VGQQLLELIFGSEKQEEQREEKNKKESIGVSYYLRLLMIN